jgi:hypothetical protein
LQCSAEHDCIELHYTAPSPLLSPLKTNCTTFLNAVVYGCRLYTTVLHCNILYYTVIYCIIMYNTTVHCIKLFYIILNCIIQYYTIHCIIVTFNSAAGYDKNKKGIEHKDAKSLNI